MAHVIKNSVTKIDKIVTLSSDESSALASLLYDLKYGELRDFIMAPNHREALENLQHEMFEYTD